MSKVHPIWSLIQSLDPAEKSYFKKFAFKKESKNKDAYKLLFDLIDKQAVFNLDKLASDKKLQGNIKSNMHASLNYLQKRIVQSMLDYRRGNNELAGIFEAILEYRFFSEKNLFSMAQSRIKSLEKSVLNNDFYYIKPQIRFLAYELLRKQQETNLEKRQKSLNEFIYSVEDFGIVSATQIIGLRIENIYIKNSGAIIKDEEDRQIVKSLLQETKDLLAIDKQDFQLRSILFNNLYILIIMGGKWEDFQALTNQMITSYQENITKKTVAKDYHDFLIVIVNLAHVCIKYKFDAAAKESLAILNRDRHLIEGTHKREEIEDQIYLLELQYFAFNNIHENSEQQLTYFTKQFKGLEFASIMYPGTLVVLCLACLKLKKYQELLDLSSTYVLEDKRQVLQGVHMCIRLIRALAWWKLENVDMFQADIQVAHKLSRDYGDSKFISGVIRFVKRLPSLKFSDKRTELIKSLFKEIEKLKAKEAPSEFMKARIFYDILQTESMKTDSSK